MSKLVTVIIPYSRDRGWLQDAILSVHNQSHQEIDLILSPSDNGVSYNINRGIEAARGEFIRYLCEDDMLTRDSIKDSLEAIGEADFLHGNSYMFNQHNANSSTDYTPPIQKPNIVNPTFKDMVKLNQIHGGTLFYRKDVFDRFGLFDEDLWTGEEYEFNLRILSKGAKLNYVDKELYIYRIHDNQKSRLLQTKNRGKRKQEINRIKNLYR